MTEREKKCMKAVADARLLKKHINLAKKRKDGTSDDFVRRLQMAYDKALERVNRFTSTGRVFALTGLVGLLLATSGCGMAARYRPNTVKGHHMDEINKHTEAIYEIDPIIYKVNKRVIPMQIEQTEERMGFQDRMRARLKAMREANQ
jgi:hypothetical protein